MKPESIARLIGAILLIVGAILASVEIKSTEFDHQSCGNALSPERYESTGDVVRHCEDEIRSRRILSVVIAAAGVLTFFFGAEIVTQKPNTTNKPPANQKKPTTEADFQEQQRARTVFREEPQWKEADPTPAGEKKFCSQCGEKLTVGAKFCSECGAAV